MPTRRTSAVPAAFIAALLFSAPAWAVELDFIDAGVRQVQQEWQAPGAVVVVIDGGEVAHARAYGVASLEDERAVDLVHTRFRLASISKPVTALAVMKLHEQGRLDLHADVHRYLDGLRVAGEGTLTAAHLLTHTGGFEDRFLLRHTRDATTLPALESYLAQQLPPRRYRAGELSLYSNHGMALAGLLVEEISGHPFAEAMEELVFRPLRMNDTSFQLTDRPPGADARRSGTHARLAQGYRFGAPVAPLGIKTVPSSMLVSTAADMTRLMQAILSPRESRLLEQDTVELMLQRHFAHHPSLTGRAYGWSEDSSVSPRRLLHSGGTDGFSSAIVLVPERSGGIFVAFNANSYVWELVREILAVRFPAESPSQQTGSAGTESSEPTIDAAGRYIPAELPRGSFDRVRMLFEQVVVESTGASISHRGELYRVANANSYRSEDGRVVVVRRGSAGETFLLEEGGAWLQLPWHASARLHAVVVTILVLALLRLGWGRAVRRAAASAARRLAIATQVAALLDLLFLVGMGAVMAITMSQGGGVLRFEIPWTVKLLLLLPLIALALTLFAGASELADLRGIGSSDSNPVATAGAVFFLLAFAFFLWYWKLLGFHF